MGTSTRIRRRRRGESEWSGLLAKQSSSGQGIAEFCRSESIDIGCFYRWRSRLSGGRPTAPAIRTERPSFVDLGSLGGLATQDSSRRGHGGALSIEVDLGGGVLLRIQRG